jgi:mono/diheme cytochrome c family protein
MLLRISLVLLLLVPVVALAAYLVAPSTADPAKPASGEPTFAKDVQPLLAKYCYGCHGGAKPKVGLALDTHKDESFVLKYKDTWDQIVQNLRGGIMPPEGKPKPSKEEVELLTTWIEKKLASIDCRQARNPGRVTIRRLNRAEYNNTIRDLVGVQFQPADDFPADDVGYGFDNIGDVLSLPPIMLEKYLAAADKIMAAAFTPSRERAGLQHFEGRTLECTFKDADRNGVKLVKGEGEVYATANFAKPGEYVLRARAYGEQAGDEVVKMALRYEGKDVQVVEVPNVEGRPRTFETRFKAEAGKRRIAAAFTNDYYNPDEADPKKRDRNLVVLFLEIEGPVDQPNLALSEAGRRIMIAMPGEGLTRREAARKIIGEFARKAYRRPVKPDEIDRLVQFVEMAEKNGEPFEKGIQLALTAVLVSPHFLFKVELDRPGTRPDGSYQISDFELATRLSYFLWSSMPDEELFELAEKGTLRRDLEGQIKRMLRNDKSYALVENFAGQWLQLRSVKTIQPDPELFPSFDEALRTAMIKETELFFHEIVKEDRSILEFLDADYTFVNERLARHYGLRGVRGNQFRKMMLTGEERGGLLTQASILAVTSNPTRTSPVKRGKWILENILNTPPPPPPPDAGELSEDKEVVLKGTLRQRMEQHRANPNCATCHQRMDPIGFGFENYDAIGAWRTKDGNFDIDPSGVLPSGEKFQGPKELKKVLLKRDELFRKCLTDRLLTFGLGRGLEPYDKCAVDDISAAVAKDGNRFHRLVLEIARSEPFQWRRGPAGPK